MLLLNNPRTGHLAQCDCFDKCYIPPNQQISRNCITFSILAKYLHGPDEMASRAGCSPQAVVWRPWCQ